jgi:hypothetical protein
MDWSQTLGEVDLPQWEAIPKMSWPQTHSVSWNQGFCDEHQELEVERKNFKTEPIRGVCGWKITRRMVTQNLWVIPTKKSPPKCTQNRRPENLQKYLWKSHKRKTHEIERFGTRLRWGFHYESLRHIRLQATLKNHKSWMAKVSNKEPLTPLSLSPQKHPKMKGHSHL